MKNIQLIFYQLNMAFNNTFTSNTPILHIPHSSTHIPSRTGYVADDAQLKAEINKLTDWFTNDLFDGDNGIKIVAPFSRIFCDVERFADDTQEPMAQYGMGCTYLSTDDGKVLRVLKNKMRNEIINQYYVPHHNLLNEAVNQQVSKWAWAMIVDCHSFSNTPFQRDANKKQPRPHINIGTDNFHTPVWLMKLAENYFSSHKLSVGINWPYSGTMVPLQHYHISKNVMSIMIELNRSLYMNENTIEKTAEYQSVKMMLSNFLKELNIEMQKHQHSAH